MTPIILPNSRRRLSLVRDGEEVKVVSFDGGRGVHRRLRELGITKGSKIRVVQNNGGPVIVMVGDSRMGLGRGISDKIQVE